jgi:hypothetical protein
VVALVIVNDVSFSGTVDMATYVGAAIGAPESGPAELGLPLVLNGAHQP